MSPLWLGLVWGWRRLLVGTLVRAWPGVSAAWPVVDRPRTSMPEAASPLLDDALRTASRDWRLGSRAKSATTARRQLWPPVPLERLATQQTWQGRAPMGPETSTVRRQPRRRIWRRATRRRRQVWWGPWWEHRLYRKGVEVRRLGLSTHQLSRAHRPRQRLATAVITGATR